MRKKTGLFVLVCTYVHLKYISAFTYLDEAWGGTKDEIEVGNENDS